MATDTHYDVIIIGTGAGGGTLAYHLAPSGKRILLLERGGYLPREKANWDSRAVFVESRYRARESWRDKAGNMFHPGIQYYVGGNTKVYGAALLTDAHVTRLETSASGREVTGVLVDHNGSVETYSGDIVVVSCGAINSAALLLRSAGERHPAGLASRSGVVGRHYMRHNCSALMAVSKTPNPTVFQKTLALNDFYFRSPDWEFPLGEIQMLGKSDGEMINAEAPGWALWKPEFALDYLAEHSIDFWLQSEDLPDPANRVTIDADGTIRLALEHVDLEGHRRLTAALKNMLTDIGCHDQLMSRSLYLSKDIPIGGTAHQAGTVRFGHDPMTSALDLHCKAHDLDNLYVVDASFFVSIAAVNPSLTIMANALRVGDHLLERLG